jgi:predicted pyridoxine 5'-phosphate oxidase superfamily flavin-nucleotide-binding protein
MTSRYAELAFTPAVRKRQEAAGSLRSYDRRVRESGGEDDALGDAEAAFIAARDSFYLATVSADGWPYVQHRGGPAGFLRVTGPRTLAFADYAGNKQYISAGNADGDGRVSLFLVDYPNRRRLKIMGRARMVERDDPAFPGDVLDPGYDAPVERAWTVEVAAFDWNCPKHITPRYTEAEVAPTLNRLLARIHDLEAQLELMAATRPR